MAATAINLRPKWLRPPLLPLVYLLFFALPLSIWHSPGADRSATAILVASIALLAWVAATASSAASAWARVYLGLGAVMAVFRGKVVASGLHANELAGAMLLFLPLAAAFAGCRALPRPQRLQAALLTVLFGGTLLATGSRGGLLALLAAGAVMLALERRWRLLGIGLLLAASLAALGPIDRLIYDGKAQGLTIDSLLTGRPEIWRRSLHSVADFSWTGIGIGAFSEVVPALYYPSGSRSLEDAHSLAIQTALDLGIGGLLAVAAIVWPAFSRARSAWRRAATASLRRGWAIGLFASLLAFGIFNLFDAIALGSPGSLPFFLLLGLIYALPRPLGSWRRWRLPARGRRRLLLGAILMLLGLSSVRGTCQLNRAAVLGARAIVHEPGQLPAAHAALDAASRSACRAGWLEGKVAQAWGRPRLRDAAWADLLRCSGAFVPMIEDELPQHRRVAELAVEVQPSNAAAQIWLARIRASSHDRISAERLYRRGLEIDPGNGTAWLELGRLLAPEDPQAALAALVESCRRGDPGANGCRAAGAMAEQLGDVEAAIRYYRRSRLAGARERADRLEVPPEGDKRKDQKQ